MRRRRLYFLVFFVMIGTVLGIDYSRKTNSYSTVEQSNKQTATPIKGNVAVAAEVNPAKPNVIHYQNKVAVLTYHNLDEKESMYTISPERFHLEMQALKDNGYNVISIEDFIDFLQKKKSVPPNAVVITFDDGYKSVYTYALPELKADGFPTTVFLIVHYEQIYNPSLPFLSWDEVKQMKKEGFSFYSHTYDLHDPRVGANGKMVFPLFSKILINKRLETDAEFEKRVNNDLTLADKLLKEQLGNQMSLLCFPHGEYSQKVIQIARKTGIQYFFSGTEGINTQSSNTVIKRINIGSPYVSPESLIQKLNYFQNH